MNYELQYKLSLVIGDPEPVQTKKYKRYTQLNPAQKNDESGSTYVHLCGLTSISIFAMLK